MQQAMQELNGISRFLEHKAENMKARHIKRSIGTRAAAGYLRNKGRSLEGAVAVLAIKRGVAA